MSKEDHVFWKNGVLKAEGLYRPATGEHGVLICHPHPLMGGSMHNNVVETVQKVFSAHGYATLRFNFRGVGSSSGTYDEGRGEKQDIVSGCDFLKSHGVTQIVLAGYSFGAWVACRLLADGGLYNSNIILISPPDKYFDFDWSYETPAVKLIVCGDSDMFCDPDALRKKALQLGAEFVMLGGTDHFYSGREGMLAGVLKKYLEEKA